MLDQRITAAGLCPHCDKPSARGGLHIHCRRLYETARLTLPLAPAFPAMPQRQATPSLPPPAFTVPERPAPPALVVPEPEPEVATGLWGFSEVLPWQEDPVEAAPAPEPAVRERPVPVAPRKPKAEREERLGRVVKDRIAELEAEVARLRAAPGLESLRIIRYDPEKNFSVYEGPDGMGFIGFRVRNPDGTACVIDTGTFEGAGYSVSKTSANRELGHIPGRNAGMFATDVIHGVTLVWKHSFNLWEGGDASKGLPSASRAGISVRRKKQEEQEETE